MTSPESGDPAAAPMWPSTEGNYLVRHWRGELPLGVSFWINGLVLGTVYTIAVLIVIYVITAIADSSAVLQAGVLALICCSYAFGVWFNIGVWSSAEHHKIHTGRKGWAIVAQILVVLSWINMAVGVFDIQRILNSVR